MYFSCESSGLIPSGQAPSPWCGSVSLAFVSPVNCSDSDCYSSTYSDNILLFNIILGVIWSDASTKMKLSFGQVRFLYNTNNDLFVLLLRPLNSDK